ncbi:MAG TPA: NADH-ubiquinone oxidoreductase-F iron-sulfur binding region domain-containing protein, partial [Geminicoccaceae bacterium]
KLMDRDAWDEVLLEELCRAMADASICGLGQAAPNPIRSAMKFFADELTLGRTGKPIRDDVPGRW